MVYFECVNEIEDEKGRKVVKREKWKGEAEILRVNYRMVEAQIEGRLTRLTVLIGVYQYGHFICIPDINVGCPLSEWHDLFWNTERLSMQMNHVDAITVATGVKAVMEKLINEKVIDWGNLWK